MSASFCRFGIVHKVCFPRLDRGLLYSAHGKYCERKANDTQIQKHFSTNGVNHRTRQSYLVLNRSDSPFEEQSTIKTNLTSRRRFTIISKTQNCDKSTIFKATPKMLQVSKFTDYLLARLISTSTSLYNSMGASREVPDEKLKLNQKCIKTITINACGELYNKLSKKKPNLYGNAPAGSGINFNINYYDSYDLIGNANNTTPTVCILHGAPGHYKEFTSLINYLTTRRVRVVAPNFPDYSSTLDHSFRHSPEERVDLLLKFFKSIKLGHIDMLIAHSSAVYTAFQLLEHSFKPDDMASRLELKSLGLFSTPTYNLPANLAVTPIRMFTLKLFDYPVFRPLIKATIELFVKIQGIRNRVDKNNIENLLLAASAVGYSDSDRSRETLGVIGQEKVPVFMVYGLNDRLIPVSSFEQLKRDLGVDNGTQVKRYDSSGKLAKDVSNMHDLVEVSEFASGGHYAFQKFASQVNEDVYVFLLRKVLMAKEETRL